MADPARAARVFVFGPIPPPVHGAARVTQQVREGVESRGTAPVVVIDTSGDVRRGPGALPARVGRMLLGLVRLLASRRGHGAVYVGGAGGPTLWYQAAVVTLARLMGLRTVFHHHSFAYVNDTMRAMRALTRGGGPRLTHVVLCPGMAEALTSRYPAVARVEVCSNAGLMRPATLRDRVPDPGAERTALYVGHLSNLSLEKGLGVVLETLRRSRAHGLDVRLLLAGPAAGEEARATVAEAVAEFGDVVEVLGAVPPDRVDDFYHRIDAFLFPSRYAHEAEPLVVLDASRNGVPTVAYGVGCLPGMVEPDHLVPVDADFAQHTVELLSAGALAPAQVVAGRFSTRRGEALAAQTRLVDTLLG